MNASPSCLCGCLKPVHLCLGVPSFDAILEASAAQWGVSVTSLKGKGRSAPIVAARHLAMAVCCASRSSLVVSESFGVVRDTVEYACARVKRAPTESRQARLYSALIGQFQPSPSANHSKIYEPSKKDPFPRP